MTEQQLERLRSVARLALDLTVMADAAHAAREAQIGTLNELQRDRAYAAQRTRSVRSKEDGERLEAQLAELDAKIAAAQAELARLQNDTLTPYVFSYRTTVQRVLQHAGLTYRDLGLSELGPPATWADGRGSSMVSAR